MLRPIGPSKQVTTGGMKGASSREEGIGVVRIADICLISKDLGGLQ
jgi:hypothetical protein